MKKYKNNPFSQARYPIQTVEFVSKKSPTLAMHLKAPFNFKGFPLRNNGKTQLAGEGPSGKDDGSLDFGSSHDTTEATGSEDPQLFTWKKKDWRSGT